MQFVAQPMVGEYGFIPTFLFQEILFLMFLLWCAQATRRNATAPNAAAKVACYFGRNSLQFLLLHGWVIITIFPFLIEWLLPYDSKAIFLALLIVNPLIHAGLFMLLKRVLNRVLAFCFFAGRWLTKPLGSTRPLPAG
jgi:fucose 4-O-acetylase-like acetyltransferase